MPTTTPQDEEDRLQRDAEASQPEAVPEPVDPNSPLSFVPHAPAGTAPVRIRMGRYGELDEHEVLRLLDTIEDERARSRFRESVYISVFIWIVIAWVVLYGPKYLWHAPQLINPADVLRDREMVQLNNPVLSPSLRKPVLKPAPKPTLDNKTLEKLRAMSPPAPAPPAPTPAAQPAPSLPAPAAPTPAPARTTQPLADAPTPQPATKPNFNTPNSASESLNNAIREAARNRSGGNGVGNATPTARGAVAGGGVEVLSDMQGVDFSDYLRRVYNDVKRNWIPLLPEETEPPLMKQGETYIRFTILPDGRIGNMVLEGSSHDVAIDKAAWGSITSEGQFPPLPAKFHGPNLELRFHYMVNKGIQQ